MSTQLKKVTIYLEADEYERMKALAEDEGVTVSAIVRAKLGLSYKGTTGHFMGTNQAVPNERESHGGTRNSS